MGGWAIPQLVKNQPIRTSNVHSAIDSPSIFHFPKQQIITKEDFLATDKTTKMQQPPQWNPFQKAIAMALDMARPGVPCSYLSSNSLIQNHRPQSSNRRKLCSDARTASPPLAPYFRQDNRIVSMASTLLVMHADSVK